MEQTVTTSTTKGIVISLILIVIALISYFLNLDTSGPLQWIGYLVFIAGIVWSVNLYGKQMNHVSTFGNYFAHGFKTAAVVTVIMLLYVIVFIYLFPDMKEKGIEAARKKMEAKGELSQDQISQGLEFTRKHFMLIAIAASLFFYLVVGAIAALIGAGITKRNPAPLQSVPE